MKSVKLHLFQVVGSMAFHIFFFTWIQCSSDIRVREVQAAVMGSVTITFNYDSYWYKNLISSWCRQVSMTECENIVDTSVANRDEHNRRVFLSQNTERLSIVNVTMVNLQCWDTGLYKWRIWTGTDYDIIENVLLQVVFGLPPKLHVAIYKLYDTVEMNCEYNQRQKWSKAWFKKLGHDKLQWLVHSDGNVNMDYSARSIVYVDETNRVLEMKIINLELWDSGFYQCREAGGETILKEILLLVTLDTYEDSSDHTTFSTSIYTSTSPNTIPGKTYASPVDVKANISNGKSSNFTEDSIIVHHRTWDILRWVLLLCMGLCVILFTFYQKFLGELKDFLYIHICKH
ncbi:hypothetical protein GDO81_006272 [Engystomops pustulosus]|uniref:Ig-like domain-containing protein n=1 Tax=Engystomops pustulosus TaxID=76066 RepID=A0AAV7CVH3_ENGPU|nr:hypothetical protein GDO81_006272 [Engystomops pustulosus]